MSFSTFIRWPAHEEMEIRPSHFLCAWFDVCGRHRWDKNAKEHIFLVFLAHRTWDFSTVNVPCGSWQAPQPVKACLPPAVKITTVQLQPRMASRPASLAHHCTSFHTLLPLAVLLMCQEREPATVPQPLNCSHSSVCFTSWFPRIGTL